MFTLTETEAKNYGLFLCTCLQKLAQWHQDKALYEKECVEQGLPGFVQTWRAGESLSIPVPKDRIFDHETFRQLMAKWHLKLRTVIISSL